MTNFATRPLLPVRHGAKLRVSLLCGASVGALLFAAPTRAASPIKLLTQTVAQSARAATAITNPATSVRASQQAALGAQNLASAAGRYSALTAQLAAASNGGAGAITVVDGTNSTYNAATGLCTTTNCATAPATGAAAGLAIAGNAITGVTNGVPTLNAAVWSGASLPSQSVSNGRTTVTITQSQQLAQLTWASFNVGAKTTLDFNQSAGGTLASSWVVINYVQNPLASPAQILGEIQAPGKVYIIDTNGVAFSAGSQVNVGSLIAATADIAAAQFSTTASGQSSFNLYGAQTANVDAISGLTVAYTPTFDQGSATAAITVAPGASIQTTTPTGTAGGGYVMLLGANVANEGLIDTPQGQTILAAGQDFTLRPGSTGSTTSGNIYSTTLGSEIATTNVAANGTYTTGSVFNGGVIVADQGDITLAGHALTQAGVLLSTTTVDTRGTIHFLTPTDGSDPTSSITLAPGSVTEILPEDNGETALDSQRAADVAASALLNGGRAGAAATNPELNDSNTLPDQIAESRVEISTGGNVDVQGSALVVAPGGQIAVGGGSSVLVETGATLDVSGSTSAVLPASVNDVLVNVQPFQLRDSAANRTGALKGTNVNVDARDLVEIASGAYAGNIYTAGGLLEVSGYLGLVAHGIDEWTAIGGQVTLQAQQTALGQSGSVAGTVTTMPGSVINLTGGTVTYAAGPVAQTYVVATTGQVFDVNNAPGDLVYVGIYDGFTVDHARWKVSDSYSNPLLTPATIIDPSYVVGRDAGTLTVNAGTLDLEGAVPAGVTLGQYQNGPRPSSVTDPYLLAQTVVPEAGSLIIGNYLSGVLQTTPNDTDITIAASASATATALSSGAAAGFIGSGALNSDGFGTISIITQGDITLDAPLAVADGGAVTLAGANVALNQGITARSGHITVTDQQSGVALGAATSITLAPGATLDARGIWTNVPLNPDSVAGLGYANGGTIAVLGSQAVDLAAGSVLNVSSGGALESGGKTLTANGGAITVDADVILPTSAQSATDPVTLDALFEGYGSKAGGTLSLAVPNVAIGGDVTGSTNATLVMLAQNFFQSGFSRYVIDGTQGLTVLPGAQVAAAEPVYGLDGGANLPSGSDPSQVYAVILPPLYTQTKGSDAFSERGGASVTLLSSIDPTSSNEVGGGSLTISAGASVSVDPGQSITLAAKGQVTVLGTLTAHGGSINIANTSFDPESVITGSAQASQYQPGVSVWLGAGSLVDVSGVAVTGQDSAGRVFGFAQSGGTIALGGYSAAGVSTWAQVIERPGAVLDANGAAASVTLVPGIESGTVESAPAPVTLVGNGGTISATSLTGIALDGAFTASGGGAGAAGGALSLTLAPTQLGAYDNIPTYVFQPREILVSAAAMPVQSDSALQPGDIAPAATFGLVGISQAQINAGGFDAISLSAQGGAIVFDGNVSLSASRSLSLATGVVGDSTDHATVSLAAPHVSFVGYNEGFASGTGDLSASLPLLISTGTLTVTADLLDFSDAVFLGGAVAIGSSQAQPGAGGFGPPAAPVTTTAYGFVQTNFVSTGDIRFLGSTYSGESTGVLTSEGNLTFQAAQLYPISFASEQVTANYNAQGLLNDPFGPASYNGTILIKGNGTAPQSPYSIGGTLQLVASNILQQGIIRAPEGEIFLNDGDGGDGTLLPSQVILAPGSVTSVSLDGQTVPYGGTADGVTYLAPGGGTPLIFNPVVAIQAQSVTAEAGATIDLRGGGTLSGASFVYGRGGSADVLTTPLLNTSGGAAVAEANAQVAGVAPVGSGDPVYAILPSYTSAYAPAAVTGDSAYTATKFGEQITVASGEVPGLAAGTYTILPAYYALLPGGYRVELTSGAIPAASIAEGNFSELAPVTVSIANTGIASATPQGAIFTSGSDVRQLSQYDEETYNAFEAASATQFGAPRPFLPEDAKTLLLTYPSTLGTNATSTGTALSFAAGDLLDAPATGGFGATVEINTDAAIAVAGATDVAPAGDLVFSDATLNSLQAPRLVLGGTLTPSASIASDIVVTGNAASIEILPDASLVAGDIMAVTSNGAISVDAGASISAVGSIVSAGSTITLAPAYNASTGYYFSSEYNTGLAYPVLAISNGDVVFVPNNDAAPGASINIGNGSSVLAAGSLNIIAPSGTEVTVGSANIGAKYANIAVAAVNIGSAPELAALGSELPAGINFTPQSLAALLDGSAALGTPANLQFTLTASQEVNLLGDVSINTGSTDFVLNTPAIYGVGTTNANGNVTGPAVASITAPSFTWNGVLVQNPLNTGAGLINASALPGGQIAAGLASTPGSLSITAGTITLGYGPQTQPNDQVQLGRVIEGFANVTLDGGTEITANNQSSLSVFAQGGIFGQPGSGGNLNLVTPLLTTASGAVLNITAGGTLSAATPAGVAPSATSSLATQGGEISLTAGGDINISTAIALPAGQLNATAQNNINVSSGASLDLSGRATPLLDQTVYSNGGSIALESTAGSIDLASGATLDVGSPGAASGSISLSALAGSVNLDAALQGSAVTGQTSGSFSVIAGTLSTSTTQSADAVFGVINTALNSGDFDASRSFEVATLANNPTLANNQDATTQNITIANDANGNALVNASHVSITADAGSIDITGTINASGSGPGTVSLSAQQNLTLAATGLIDVHATATAVDSSGNPIAAENAADVTLSSTAGSLILAGGAVNLSYAGIATGGAQGQLVLNAPRVGSDNVAIDAAAPIDVTGAQSIALYAWRRYMATDPLGTITQSQAQSTVPGGSTVTLDQIDADNTAFMTAAGQNSALAAKLAGLAAYGANFHLRPGVEIDSSAASGGTLTISGDLDFSGLRYSDVGYGTQQTGIYGSGEPGAVVFRASSDLIVNGSVTDGFAPPPGTTTDYLRADDSWVILSQAAAPQPDPLSADILLPSSISISNSGTVIHSMELAAGTSFSEARAISLNYAITVAAPNVAASTVIPFGSSMLVSDVTVPAGGFVTTAAITPPGGPVIPAGTYLAGGTVIAANSALGAGSVLPVAVQLQDNVANPTGNLTIPSGTLLSMFNDGSATLTLAANTAVLPVNAFLPSNTVPIFVTPDGTMQNYLALRPLVTPAANVSTNGTLGDPLQGAIYALAQMLPAGSLSWSMGFVAGANQASASQSALLPKSVLNGGALAVPANTENQAPGSLILDDQHYFSLSNITSNDSPAFSVIRTGTGNLTLAAGGDFDQDSLYGIYTAGTQDPLPGGDAANAPYDAPREGVNGGSTGTITANNPKMNAIVAATYQAYYPTNGGNLSLSVQGDATGDLYGSSISFPVLPPSAAIGNWLFRQGSTQLGQPTAWWINFGTIVTPYAAGDLFNTESNAALVGYQGIGTLGGGNLTVNIGGNAGQITDRTGEDLTQQLRGEGLVFTVASTGREISANGTSSILQTGGGSLTLNVGGTINPIDGNAYGLPVGDGNPLNGEVADLRGNITITAGAIGRDDVAYLQTLNDPTPSPFGAANYTPQGGLTIVPGDGIVSIATNRDLVLDGIGDAGRVTEQSLTFVPEDQVGGFGVGGASGFTLWTANTAVDLFSSGGNVTPVSAPVTNQVNTPFYVDDGATDQRLVVPSQLSVIAATGDITYGIPGSIAGEGQSGNTTAIELMPSANEQVQLLAGNSILANDLPVDLSGANPQGLSTPLNPAFFDGTLTNIRTGAGTEQSVQAIFALAPDTPTAAYLSSSAAAQPALFYAASGDIINFVTGQTLTFPAGDETLSNWYIAAKSVAIEAGGDIISSGTRPDGPAAGSVQQNQASYVTDAGITVQDSGNLFLNPNAQSVSVVQAGQDILSGYFYVGGPGLLTVTAGRNIQQIGYSFNGSQELDFGSIKSLGSLETGAPVSLTGGAGIDVLAGLGSGAAYTAFADLYLNPANQANLALPITDPANKGKVQLVYASQLLAWLQTNYGYTGTSAGALKWFLNAANVPVASQQSFLLGVFYAELLASGEQYNDASSRFFGSYVRGRTAIDTLLPGQNGQTTPTSGLNDGIPAGYTGGITMASGTLVGGSTVFDAGVATEHGGGVDVLDPGGDVILGTSGGVNPGAGTGLITNGTGDIDVFATGNVLLGKSRIFTNAGGNIQIWSASGNINAGIGARTSVVYNAPVITYDDTGGITDSPAVPTSGAGIATQQPLPSIPPGNIDLTAPVGTIDAGEAGVRSSGNLNLAAARLANASGFSAGGKTSGNAGPATVSLGAVEAAGAAAGAASSAAAGGAASRSQDQVPSIVEVEVLSVTGPDDQKRKKHGA